MKSFRENPVLKGEDPESALCTESSLRSFEHGEVNSRTHPVILSSIRGCKAVILELKVTSVCRSPEFTSLLATLLRFSQLGKRNVGIFTFQDAVFSGKLDVVRTRTTEFYNHG